MLISDDVLEFRNKWMMDRRPEPVIYDIDFQSFFFFLNIFRNQYGVDPFTGYKFMEGQPQPHLKLFDVILTTRLYLESASPGETQSAVSQIMHLCGCSEEQAVMLMCSQEEGV